MRTIKGFPDYRIDSSGQIWSFKNVRKTTNGEPVPRKLKPTVGKNGRVRYQMENRSGRYTRSVDQLLLASWQRPPKKDEVPFHKNGNTRDNRIENLEWKKKDDVTLELMKVNATSEQKQLTKHLRRQIRMQKIRKEYVQQNPEKPRKNKKEDVQGGI